MHDTGSYIFWFVLTLSVLAGLAWFTDGFYGVFERAIRPLTLTPDGYRRMAPVVATFTGIAGAWLLALPNNPGWGFGAFLVSNVAWLIFSFERKHWWLLVQQIAFFFASLLGLWNWWLGPLLRG